MPSDDLKKQEVEAEFQKNQGKLLKKARNSCSPKLSQEAVAAKFGVSQVAISLMEKGKMPISSYRLMQFAKIYNKPVSFFYMVNLAEMSTAKPNP